MGKQDYRISYVKVERQQSEQYTMPCFCQAEGWRLILLDNWSCVLRIVQGRLVYPVRATAAMSAPGKATFGIYGSIRASPAP